MRKILIEPGGSQELAAEKTGHSKGDDGSISDGLAPCGDTWLRMGTLSGEIEAEYLQVVCQLVSLLSSTQPVEDPYVKHWTP